MHVVLQKHGRFYSELHGSDLDDGGVLDSPESSGLFILAKSHAVGAGAAWGRTVCRLIETSAVLHDYHTEGGQAVYIKV